MEFTSRDFFAVENSYSNKISFKDLIFYLIIFILMAEFQPGVPWKGIQSSGDSKTDPYMAPGSVLGSPGTSSLNDSDHQLLRDNIGMRVFQVFLVFF